MRTEISPPPIDPEKLSLLTGLGKQAIAALDSRQNYDDLVEEFSELAGTEVDISELDMATGEMNLETFVKLLLVPRATLRDDITEDDLLEIVAAFQAGEIEEHERGYWSLMLELHLPATHVDDITEIGETVTPAEYIAMARMRRPILL